MSNISHRRRKTATDIRFALAVNPECEKITIDRSILLAAAEILATPAWFSAWELRLAADAMELSNQLTAEALTLRYHLSKWLNVASKRNAESFAFYLDNLPNEGSAL